ncbi:MAG TPA: nitrate reductase associated protein [Chroococcidiopsis sp.]
MSTFFQFEADFVETLRCIPMVVRFKLDTCGIKLKLQAWHQLSPGDRQALATLPCTTAAEIAHYQTFLQQRLLDCTGAMGGTLPIDPQPPWLDAATIPAELDQAIQALGVALNQPSNQPSSQPLNQSLNLVQWAALTPLQRFALLKLSRPGHENRNLLPALKEFGLI